MGRNRCRGKVKVKIPEQLTDITLNDCANNPRKLLRPKSKKHALDTELIEDVNYSEEKDLCQISNKFLKQKVIIAKTEETSGTTYPPDIWFLIAPYIPMENICNFALICQDTCRVTRSVHFWKQLYKQFYKNDTLLPHDLHGYCDEQLGLRARVIRTLYFLYPPLMKNIKTPIAPRYEPYTLQGKKLLLTWHEKEEHVWNFYFKFLVVHKTVGEEESRLYFNPEADYRILKATCAEFICFPYPQYPYLLLINMGLSSDMRRHKLTLGFSDYTTTHSSSKVKQTLGRSNHVSHQIELDSISKCVVLDWWHPEYPHPRRSASKMNTLCSTEEW